MRKETVEVDMLQDVNKMLWERFLGSLIETSLYKREAEDEYIASLVNRGNEDYPDIRW